MMYSAAAALELEEISLQFANYLVPTVAGRQRGVGAGVDQVDTRGMIQESLADCPISDLRRRLKLGSSA